jgi:hypothetical protein
MPAPIPAPTPAAAGITVSQSGEQLDPAAAATRIPKLPAPINAPFHTASPRFSTQAISVALVGTLPAAVVTVSCCPDTVACVPRVSPLVWPTTVDGGIGFEIPGEIGERADRSSVRWQLWRRSPCSGWQQGWAARDG